MRPALCPHGALQAPSSMALQHGVLCLLLQVGIGVCSPSGALQSRQTEVGSSLLHPSPRSPPLQKKTSAPSQAAICLFGWTWNLLKCLSMDEATESRRTEPGRLLGEWKIIFWDFLEFEAPMMDVHARDGNGFVSIKTQSERITLPNRLRNGCWAGSALL